MAIDICRAGLEELAEYEELPASYMVESQFRVEEMDGSFGGLKLIEETVASPYSKEDGPGEAEDSLADWFSKQEEAKWACFLARDGKQVVGGVIVAGKVARIFPCGENEAVLIDLCVHPEWRQRGIGGELVRRAAGWARERGYVRLKLETQNVNMAACRMYAKLGCKLGGIISKVYPEPYEHEVMLLWHLEL